MKLISLSLVGYRQFLERIEIEFPQGMTGICGPNGVGKSKLIEAIGFALYGPRTQILPTGDKSEFIPSLTAAAQHIQTEVVLTIEVKAERYVITRSLTKAEVRIVGAADTLATTPTGVTLFVTRLLRLSAEAFVGTFVARQNEIAKLHMLDKKHRVDLIHRLIGISQLQIAVELADKEAEGLKQELRRAEGALTTSSTVIEAEIRDCEVTLKSVVNDQNQAAIELASCSEELKQKRVALDDAALRREKKLSKIRELDGLRVSHGQTANHLASVRASWERSHAALARHNAIEKDLTDLADAEACFKHWETMKIREEILLHQQSLKKRLLEFKRSLETFQKIESERHSLIGTMESIVAEIGTVSTEKTLISHHKTQAETAIKDLADKRRRMVEIGPGGICENCGLILEESSFLVVLETCDKSILKLEREKENAVQDEGGLTDSLQILEKKHLDLLAKRSDAEKKITTFSSVPGQIESIEQQLVTSSQELFSLTSSDNDITEVFSQLTYDEAKKKVDHKVDLISELRSVSVLASGEEKCRVEVEEAEKWLTDLGSQIQALEADIKTLCLSDLIDEAAEDAFNYVEEKHRDLSQKERDALQYVTQAKTRLEERQQNLVKIKAEETKLELLRQKGLIVDRTLELMRQMLNEINEEARPRIAELMDMWLRSLIGEKFLGVTLSEDYRVLADCGAGFRMLDHFSGGEQTLLAVMLRIAISLFCQERAGFDTSFMILDEVFGNQDNIHRSQLVGFLTEIQEHYHQILIVNHVEDVTQMLDTIIEVIPTGLTTSSLRKNTVNA